MSKLFRFFRRWWRWIASGLIGAITLVAVAVGLRNRSVLEERKRLREARDRELRKADVLIEQARTQAREAAEAERQRARQRAEDAEWSKRKAEIEAQRIRHLPPTEREAEVRRTKDKLRKTGRSLVLLGCLLTAGSARAAEPMDHPSTLTAGWWMDDAEHAETAAWLAELADLRDAYAALSASNASYQTAAQHDATQVAVSMSLVRACAAQLDLAQADRDELREAASRWHRRPAVLLGVGFGAGAALVTALVLGVR